jgi:hypothetical protein
MRAVSASLVVWFATLLPATAQGLLLPIDTSAVVVHRAPVEVVQQIKADPDFRYHDPVPSRASFTDWIRYWWDRIMSPVFDSPLMDPLWRIALWLFAGATVAYIVAKLTGTDLRGVLQRKSREVPTFSLSEASVDDLDFDRMIEQALDQQRYRQALRLQYLRLLRGLADHGMIRWTREKTNNMYVREFPNEALRPTFASITRTFNTCWYGNSTVWLETYETLRRTVDDFLAAVQSQERQGVPE